MPEIECRDCVGAKPLGDGNDDGIDQPEAQRPIFTGNDVSARDIFVSTVLDGKRPVGQIREKRLLGTRSELWTQRDNRPLGGSPTVGANRWDVPDTTRTYRNMMAIALVQQGQHQPRCRRRSPRTTHALQQLLSTLAQITAPAVKRADALRSPPTCVASRIFGYGLPDELRGRPPLFCSDPFEGAIVGRIEIDRGFLLYGYHIW